MRFEARIEAVLEGGTIRNDSNRLRIDQAKSVTLLVSAKTGYRGFDRPPDLTRRRNRRCLRGNR